MKTRIIEYINRFSMLRGKDTIVVGVSGGADSVCLLFLLCDIVSSQMPNIDIEVVHINHLIREDAGDDAGFVENYCRQLEERFGISIPCHIIEVDVEGMAGELKLSVEEAGRKARYDAFNSILKDRNGVIAVAHNKDDRAETMLLNLFRGTGIKGLSGISPVNGNIIRPLLGVTRKEIEEFDRKEGLSFVTDSTNLTDDYTRNKIRHNILDYARGNISLSVTDNMENTANQLELAESFLHSETVKALTGCILRLEKGMMSLDSMKLSLLHPYIRDRVLYEVLVYVGGQRKDITGEHVGLLRSLLCGTRSKSATLIYGINARRENDRLTVWKNGEYEEKPEQKGHIITRILEDFDPSGFPKDTYTKWFDYDKISSVAMLRCRKEGDYLTINKEGQTKSLKDYFINEKVPKSQRDDFPLLADNDHIMWVIGKRISEYYKVSENTIRVLEVKYEREN